MLKPVVLDYETYFADDYTLSRMSTESYIRDPRFEAHGAAIKWEPNIPARWYAERELRYILKEHDWSQTILIAWHAQFDGLILSHKYDVHPARIVCPMSMFRLLYGTHLSASLDNVRKHFGMPLKTTPYNLFRNKHWHELDLATQEQIGTGAEDEVESIWKLFGMFAKNMPLEEYEVLDTTLKMFTEPMLRADTALLAKVWEREEQSKASRMAALGVTETELQSADKFAELLRAEDIEPEMKKGKNGPIYAFAKTDDFMRDLLEHEDERVQTLAEARLGLKSTLMQTRAETFGWTASRGSIPVYLNYCGAGTLRPSAGDKTGFLNLKRQSDLRRSLTAPDGYLLAPIDASQIECRCLHYLAGGPDEPVIQQFRAGVDVYVAPASKFYGHAVYKPKPDDPRKDEMEAKRGMGKQGRLMCGYGAGGAQFKRTAKNGLYGPPVDISIEDANAFVKLYREDNPSICASHTGYWAQANRMLARLAGGPPVDWGPLHVRDHRIYLPNGCPLIYDTLEFHRPEPDEEVRDFEADGYWRVKTRTGYKKMWGSKLVQNICEAVSRVIVSQAMIRITRMGYRVLNWPYDELLVLIPKDGHEQEHLERCKAEMVREPTWLPGIPLDCEGSLGERYSK